RLTRPIWPNESGSHPARPFGSLSRLAFDRPDSSTISPRQDRHERIAMRRRMMKSKIHRATVTDANLAYVGSITLDTRLMELADIREWEQGALLATGNGAPL